MDDEPRTNLSSVYPSYHRVLHFKAIKNNYVELETRRESEYIIVVREIYEHIVSAMGTGVVGCGQPKNNIKRLQRDKTSYYMWAKNNAFEHRKILPEGVHIRREQRSTPKSSKQTYYVR